MSWINREVQRLITREQRQAEQIISWLEFGIFSFLLILYSLSPKAFSDTDIIIKPVPWIIFIFLILIGSKIIILKYLEEVRLPFIYFVTICEPILLAFLIWSYHIQYLSNPTLSLKAPTFAYFFIFLALSSLRYDVKLLVVGGISSALSWLALLGYALITPGVGVTHSFTEYIFSNKVLVGAEIDKTIVIVLVTAILALGIRRSKAILWQGLQQEETAKSFARFFSPQVAQHITQAQADFELGKGKLCNSVSLSMDLRDFTKYSSQRPPEEVMGLLSEYQHLMSDIIYKHHGVVDKFMGDGILAHFGTAEETETYAADSLRAALEMKEEAKKFFANKNTAISDFGIACVAGPTIFGVVGDANKFELTVIGSSVNLSTKLEKYNKELKSSCITTAATFSLARDQGLEVTDYKELSQQKIEGIEEEVDLVMF